MGDLNYTTNESLLQMSSVFRILLLKKPCKLLCSVKLCLIFVDVNQDVRATDGCAGVSLRLARKSAVGERQTSSGKLGTQLSLALLLKLRQ